MSNNGERVSLNINVLGTGIISTAVVTDESKMRIVISDAGAGNTILVKAQIIGQTDWDTIATLTGSIKQSVNISTYDIVQLECTSFSPTLTIVKVIAGSFRKAGGATAIDAPTGGTIESDLIAFTSSDNSVEITSDPLTNSIDFRAIGGSATVKYVRTILLGDWVGPSGGEYTLSIPFTTHAKTNPVVTCLETNGGDFDVINTQVVLTGNNVSIKVLSSPDTRFAGKIFIE